MKKNAKPENKFISPRFQQIAIAMGLALIISAGIASALWLFIIKPSNQQQFNQQVIDNAENYRDRIQQLVQQLQNPLEHIAENISASIFEQDQQQLEQWVAAQQSNWLPQLPHVNTITLLDYENVQQQVREGKRVSFIVIDMINRLEVNKPTYIEVAKNSDNTQWQMHKVVAIRNLQNKLVGVLYATFSLTGLEKLFTPDNLSLAQVVLRQYIDNEAPLTFLSLGQSSNKYPQKVLNIPNTYWQLAYLPSEMLFKQTSMNPLWLWLFIILTPLVIYFASMKLLFPIENEQLPSKQKKTKVETHTDTQTEIIEEEILETPAISDDTKVSTEKVQSEGSSQQPSQNMELPDSVFRAYDIRGIAHEQITHDLMYSIGQAVATEVLNAGDKAIVIGRDSRIHSLEFSQCVIEGIISTGCDVIDIGIVPTPLMNFTACQDKRTSSGLIVTASHNPSEYNGCKIVIKGQTLVDDDIQALKNRIANNEVIQGDQKGTVVEDDFTQAYIDRIIGDVAVIDGWRIVVDAGNGASSVLAPKLFQAMKCDVIPLFCEFDGNFPNHSPDPSVPENLVQLIDKVKAEKADIGFALDGDGDRLIVVTQKGRVLWPDNLLMLFAQDIVARNPGSDVVFDIKSSQLLGQIITEHGGRPILWKTGHSHIKAKMKETQALLGGEFSGHIFFKERWFGFDDGLYAAARLLEILTLTGQTIDNLLTSLPTTISTPEIKISVPEEQKFALVDLLIKDAHFADGEITTIDGLRVDFADGWGLVRASNTAPALTLRFEAKNEQALERIRADFQQALNRVDLPLPEFNK